MPVSDPAAPPACSIHPDRFAITRLGLCGSCYNRRWRGQHPDHQPTYNKRYYAENRERELERNRVFRDETREFVQQLKLTRGCADCGYRTHAEALEFDHVRGVKRFAVGIGRTRPREELLAEIEKCDVVCANCHRVRTSSRRATTANNEGKQ